MLHYHYMSEFRSAVLGTADLRSVCEMGGVSPSLGGVSPSFLGKRRGVVQRSFERTSRGEESENFLYQALLREDVDYHILIFVPALVLSFCIMSAFRPLMSAGVVAASLVLLSSSTLCVAHVVATQDFGVRSVPHHVEPVEVRRELSAPMYYCEFSIGLEFVATLLRSNSKDELGLADDCSEWHLEQIETSCSTEQRQSDPVNCPGRTKVCRKSKSFHNALAYGITKYVRTGTAWR